MFCFCALSDTSGAEDFSGSWSILTESISVSSQYRVNMSSIDLQGIPPNNVKLIPRRGVFRTLPNI